MIVGDEILRRGLIADAKREQLKHSTYDLTIGEIVPIGKDKVHHRVQNGGPQKYFIEPREMVWVLSAEDFSMPPTVTGIATLKTSLTKLGLLALNVGIIDPIFKGPISTALINFSDTPRMIQVGQRFFRVAFMEHADVSAFHPRDENTERRSYLLELEKTSYSEFATNFLNVPTFDDDYYEKAFWKLLLGGVLRHKIASFFVATVILSFVFFLIDLGFLDYLASIFAWIRDVLKKFSPT